MQIQEVDIARVRPLRHRVLRPDQPFDATLYNGDDAAVHLAALDEPDAVGVVSLYPDEPMPQDPRLGDFRFRGMAVAPDRQGRGLGGRLLQAMLERAWELGANRVWCNARTPAQRFYAGHGFLIIGEQFEVPDIGPHVVMAIRRNSA